MRFHFCVFARASHAQHIPVRIDIMNKIIMQRCLVLGIWVILMVYGTVTFADEPKRNSLVDKDSIDPETSCAIGRWQRCDIQEAVKHGLFETGLSPRFPEQVKCPEIDETYAISYTHERPREMYHGGIDIPAPDGTPIIAAMGGEVVAVYDGKGSPRGTEVVIRHTPEDSGLPLSLRCPHSLWENVFAWGMYWVQRAIPGSVHSRAYRAKNVAQPSILGHFIAPRANMQISETGLFL